MDVVCVPEDNAFPEDPGLKGPFTCLNRLRYRIALGRLGPSEPGCPAGRGPAGAA